MPALYTRAPLPTADRRFKDPDPVGRVAAEMLERALRNEIEINGYHEATCQVVQDYLLPGQGVAWVRYEPEIGPSISIPPDHGLDLSDDKGEIDPDDAPDIVGVVPEPGEAPEDEPKDTKLASAGNRIIRESVPIDYINWRDFLMFPVRARNWAEVVAVSKRVYMTRDQLIARFGEEIGNEIPLIPDDRDIWGRSGLVPKTSGTVLKKAVEDKAQVYEIWFKNDTEVFWLAEGYEYLCDRKDDPLKLSGFFPCPKPLFANPTTGTIVPVPDYIQYQDQALQIDELTTRIAALSKACKVSGVYNAASPEIKRMFVDTIENELIPVNDWGAFAQKNGVEGQISLMPLKEIMGVLNELIQVKERQIQEMDRLTGINDIMRGTSDARETMGGVRLKANNSGSRLVSRQAEVARFAKDLVCLIAEVMCENFSVQSIIEASGALYAEGIGPNMPLLTDMQGAQQMPPQPPQSPMLAAPPMPPSGGPPAGPPGLPTPGGPPISPQGMPQAGQPPGAGAQMGTPPGGANMAPPPWQPPGQPGQPKQQGPIGSVGPVAPPQQMGPQELMAALQRIMKAIELLKNERLRGFRVDIETDSTIYGDSQQDKTDRIEFVRTVTQYLQTAGAMASQFPDITPLLGSLLQFAVRGFRVGRDLEVKIGDFVDAAPQLIEKFKQQQSQQQQNPAEAAKAQAAVQKAQIDQQTAMIEGQLSMQEHAAEVKRQHLESQSEAFNAMLEEKRKQMDQVMMQQEAQIKQMEQYMELVRTMLAGQDLQHDMQQQQQRHAMERANPLGAQYETGVQAGPSNGQRKRSSGSQPA